MLAQEKGRSSNRSQDGLTWHASFGYKSSSNEFVLPKVKDIVSNHLGMPFGEGSLDFATYSF